MNKFLNLFKSCGGHRSRTSEEKKEEHNAPIEKKEHKKAISLPLERPKEEGNGAYSKTVVDTDEEDDGVAAATVASAPATVETGQLKISAAAVINGHSSEDLVGSAMPVKPPRSPVAKTAEATEVEVSTPAISTEVNAPESSIEVDVPASPVKVEAPPSPIKVEAPASPIKVEAPASPIKIEAPASSIKVEAPPSPIKVEAPPSPIKVEAPASPIKVEALPSPIKVEAPASPIKVEAPASPIKVEAPPSPIKVETPAPSVLVTPVASVHEDNKVVDVVDVTPVVEDAAPESAHKKHSTSSSEAESHDAEDELAKSEDNSPAFVSKAKVSVDEDDLPLPSPPPEAFIPEVPEDNAPAKPAPKAEPLVKPKPKEDDGTSSEDVESSDSDVDD